MFNRTERDIIYYYVCMIHAMLTNKSFFTLYYTQYFYFSAHVLYYNLIVLRHELYICTKILIVLTMIKF